LASCAASGRSRPRTSPSRSSSALSARRPGPRSQSGRRPA